MEVIKARGSVGQKSQMRNPRKIHHHTHPFISTHTENFAPPPNFNTIGILQTPPPPFLSHSYPTPYSLRQPPLLPLPAANHRFIPAAVKKPNGGNYRARDSSLTPKKPKLPKNSTERAIGSPAPGLLGPDPRHLTDNSNKVAVFNKKPILSSSANTFDGAKNDNNDHVDLFSGSAMYTISPPPSSLPLPTFSLRPKMSCRAVAGIDDGATDDLRRLLRLR